jgi:hypothetical protein
VTYRALEAAGIPGVHTSRPGHTSRTLGLSGRRVASRSGGSGVGAAGQARVADYLCCDDFNLGNSPRWGQPYRALKFTCRPRVDAPRPLVGAPVVGGVVRRGPAAARRAEDGRGAGLGVDGGANEEREQSRGERGSETHYGIYLHEGNNLGVRNERTTKGG